MHSPEARQGPHGAAPIGQGRQAVSRSGGVEEALPSGRPAALPHDLHGIRLVEAGPDFRACLSRSAPCVQDVDRERLVESGFDRTEKARQARDVPRAENRGTLDASSPCEIALLVGEMAARRGIEPLFPG